jgi:hypothetical protein
MKLIYTLDGLSGWILNGQAIWCNNRSELVSIGWHHVASRKDDGEFAEFTKDVEMAINHMARTGDSIAEFGTFGSFMYTRAEPEYEF